MTEKVQSKDFLIINLDLNKADTAWSGVTIALATLITIWYVMTGWPAQGKAADLLKG